MAPESGSEIVQQGRRGKGKIGADESELCLVWQGTNQPNPIRILAPGGSGAVADPNTGIDGRKERIIRKVINEQYQFTSWRGMIHSYAIPIQSGLAGSEELLLLSAGGGYLRRRGETKTALGNGAEPSGLERERDSGGGRTRSLLVVVMVPRS